MFSKRRQREREEWGEGGGSDRVVEVGGMEACMVATGLVFCLQGLRGLYLSEL